MTSVEDQEPQSAAEREEQKKYLFSPFVLLLFLIVLGLSIFILRDDKKPAITQSDGQRIMPAKRANSKPTPAELVPIHSASPGGNTSLGGGTSLGGAHH